MNFFAPSTVTVSSGQFNNILLQFSVANDHKLEHYPLVTVPFITASASCRHFGTISSLRANKFLAPIRYKILNCRNRIFPLQTDLIRIPLSLIFPKQQCLPLNSKSGFICPGALLFIENEIFSEYTMIFETLGIRSKNA